MKKEKRERTIQLKFRCTEEEAEQIRKKIKKSGCTMQDYLLQASLKSKVDVLDNSVLLAFMPEIKRIGNNINQIAKRCNEGGALARAEEVEQIQKELSEVWQLLRQSVAKQQ